MANNQDQVKVKHDASEDTLLALYNAQWQDIHHSRSQDWNLSNLIIVGLVGVGGLKVLGQFPLLQRLGALLFSAVSLLAVAVTLRHRALFREKMSAIRELELLLHAPVLFPRSGSHWPRFVAVQYILVLLYSVFACAFLYLGLFGGGR